ncbi:MAG: SDR family oxidoreductase [Oscillatoriaceae cyanobacterium Prado104]|jgi:3-oxoacyl-[acyl-carrier protein] reductase|nr:SDR family oxidoreductase [Oscillatoriaceae cyanobacterium Prado104]
MKNRLVIILGANGVLGSAICDRTNLAVDIIGIDIQSTTSITNLKDYFACDIGNRDLVRSTVEQIPFAEYQKVILISCIGKFGEATFQSAVFDENSLYESIQVNLLGVSHFMVAALKKCLAAKILTRAIVISSAAAYVGSRDIGYGIAKAGLNGLVLSLSKSLACHNFVVLGINPGIFESKMSVGVALERQAQAVESTHIKRKGKLDEIVNFVTYAAFEAPDYLTGSILNINGGQYT